MQKRHILNKINIVVSILVLVNIFSVFRVFDAQNNILNINNVNVYATTNPNSNSNNQQNEDKDKDKNKNTETKSNNVNYPFYITESDLKKTKENNNPNRKIETEDSQVVQFTDNEDLNEILSYITAIFSFAASLVILALKILVVVIVTVLTGILGTVLAGQPLTIDMILFNKIPALNLEYGFDAGKYISFNKSIATGTMTLMLMGASIQFLVLLYISIRYMMAMASISKPKTLEQLKLGLIGWIKGVFILFGTVIFAITVIKINNAFVSVLEKSFKAATNSNSMNLYVMGQVFDPGIGGGIALVTYLSIQFQTLALYLYYVKRYIYISFLILISPIISSTYAIDILGDQKAQTVQKWTTEFVYNVFIQLFHILIYFAIVMPILTGNANHKFDVSKPFSNMLDYASIIIFLMISVTFFFNGEKLLSKLFGFNKAKQVGDSAAKVVAVGTTAVSLIKKGLSANKTAKDEMKAIREASSGNTAQSTPEKTFVDKLKEKKDDAVNKVKDFKENKLSDVLNKSIAENTKSVIQKLKARKAHNKNQKRLMKKAKKAKKKKIKYRRRKMFGKILGKGGIAVGTYIAASSLKNSKPISSIYAMASSYRMAGEIGKLAQDKKKELFGSKIGASNRDTDRGLTPKPFILSKEKIAEIYNDKADKYAEELARNSEMLEELTGVNFDATTEDGKENLETYTKFVNEKSKGKELNKEYKEKFKALRAELMTKYEITSQEAVEMMNNMIDEIQTDKKLIVAGLTEKEKDFVGIVIAKNMETLNKKFNEMSKEIKSDVVPYDEEKAVLGRFDDVIARQREIQEKLLQEDRTFRNKVVSEDDEKLAMNLEKVKQKYLKDNGIK